MRYNDKIQNLIDVLDNKITSPTISYYILKENNFTAEEIYRIYKILARREHKELLEKEQQQKEIDKQAKQAIDKALNDLFKK